MSESSNKQKYEMNMCEGPLMRQLISFTLPLLISSNLQLLFNAADIIVVGQFSGNSALAAVGSTTSLIHLMITLLTGISLGTNVVAGQLFATNKDEEMQKLVHTSMAFALAGGIVIGVLGIFTAGTALQMMRTPADVFPEALLYMKVYFTGMPFFMIYTYGAAVLRAVGDTRRPLLFLTAAGIINVILNLILVIVFHQGVLGVAVATVISQAVSGILVLRCLWKTEGSYQLRFSRLRIRSSYLLRILKIGLPAGIQSLVINFSNVLLQSSVNSFGSVAMAGYTAANNIFGFLYVTANSFTQTCMCFISQNYGVKNFKRMKQIIKDCLLLSVGTMAVLGGLVYLFGDSILRIYTSDGEAIQCGVEIFLYTTSIYFIFAVMDLLPGIMRGLGYSAIPMILSVLGTVGTRIFWIYCVFPFHRKLDILFISYPLSWIVTVLMQAVYLGVIWKKEMRHVAS